MTFREYLRARAAEWREAMGGRLDRETRADLLRAAVTEWAGEVWRAVYDRREVLPDRVVASARRMFAPDHFRRLLGLIHHNRMATEDRNR